MTPERRRRQPASNPGSGAHATETPAGQYGWLQVAVGQLSDKIDEQRRDLTAAVEKQSDKIDAQRRELTTAMEAQRRELTAMIEAQTKLVQTAQSGLDKLSGGIWFAKWAIGIALTLAGLDRLPAIIDAIARAFGDG